MSTKIKRLKQNGEEFVPITLAEAVVVNTNGIPGTIQEITTLDKVLRRTIGAINNNTENINSAVETINNLIISKQDKLTAGYGIEIDSNNKISVTLSYTLYQIVTQLPEPSAQVMNTIYLVPSAGEEGNMYTEWICLHNPNLPNIQYYWERLGTFKADVDLSDYVTKSVMYTYAITAESVKTSEAAGSANVIVDYQIPLDLYDSAVVDITTDRII